MLSRRDALQAAAAAALLWSAGCTRPQERADDAAPTWPRRSAHEGLEVLELFPNKAVESSPLVIAIHGRGDRPDNWVETWRTFPARARIVLPRGFDPFGDGFTWFSLRSGMPDEVLGAEVAAAEARLWKGLAKLAQGRRMVVTGFSQGGILSFALAARHPDVVAKAFPVAGLLPNALAPKTRPAPIVAFHGTADDVLDVQGGRAAVSAFQAAGGEATLREYPGVRHTITQAMRTELWAEIQKALPSAG